MNRSAQSYTIKVDDYTTYEAGKSRNGGCYSFHETAIVENGQIVRGEHKTSAEFDYCPFCGRFERRIHDHVERWHGGWESDEYFPSPLVMGVHQVISDGMTRGDSEESIVSAAEKYAGKMVEVFIE